MDNFSLPLISLTFFAVFILTIFTGIILLPVFKKMQVGQMVRDEGPKTHLKKNGTPTFGGLFFCLPIICILLFLMIKGLIHTHIGLPFLLSIIFLGTVGFTDDYIKIRVNKEGLSFRQKTLIQSLVILPLVAFLVWGDNPLPLFIPFTASKLFWVKGPLSLLYALLLFAYFYFFINAVNYTDGVDGLVSMVSIAILGSFGLAIYQLPKIFINDFHQMESWNIYSLQKGDGSNLAASLFLISIMLIAGLCGFLVFNFHPAKVFMGDFGSLALGISISLFPVYLGVPWLMLLFGLIYFIEAISSLLQIAYYRYSGGKRIFKMAPIHHHFELSGWSEKKVVFYFTLFALLSSLLASGIYKLIVMSLP